MVTLFRLTPPKETHIEVLAQFLAGSPGSVSRTTKGSTLRNTACKKGTSLHPFNLKLLLRSFLSLSHKMFSKIDIDEEIGCRLEEKL